MSAQVRLDEDVYAALRKLAADERRTAAAQLNYMLRTHEGIASKLAEVSVPSTQPVERKFGSLKGMHND